MEVSVHISVPLPRALRWSSAVSLAAVALVSVPSALAQSASSHRMPSHESRSSLATGSGHGRTHGRGHDDPRHAVGQFAQRNLVADTAGAAELQDPDLVNAWGLSFGPTTPAWVSDAGTGKSTLYAGGVGASPVTKTPLTVSIPGGAPTGQVFNSGSGFVVSSGAASAPAAFLFATGTGTIAGWNPNVPAAGSMAAQTAVTVPGAEFTGLAITGDRLYAADFHDARVDVWDANFTTVKDQHAFQDRKIPAGYAPFGIEAIGNKLVVTYAKQDANAQLDVPGAGHGFVDVFSTSGRLEQRLAARGPLNSPWGVAQAPQDFGAASGALLIGNFGDGRITAYAPNTGRVLGQLADSHRRPIVIDGLWALKFGNGTIGARNALLFTAGPSHGMHGLFGELTATTPYSTATR
jgi:uncharacterized protein (TIGR03118 family)